jgi:RarD protein
VNSVLKLVIAMTIWGSIGVFVKNISLQSFEVAFLRATIASVFVGIIFLIKLKKEKKTNLNTEKKEDKYSKKNLLTLILSGIFMGLNWVLLFESYKYITVANATLTYYFAPVIVVFLSPIVLKEKFTYKSALSVIAAMFGLCLILNSNTSDTIQGLNQTKGIIIALGAAALYAAIIILNKYIQDFSDYERTFIQLFSSALVLLPFVIYRGCLKINDIKSVVLIIILGIVHTGVTYFLYFSAIKKLKAQTTALLSYIDPISSIFFSLIFLSESLSIWQVVGGSIILMSTLIGKSKIEEENEAAQ